MYNDVNWYYDEWDEFTAEQYEFYLQYGETPEMAKSINELY